MKYSKLLFALAVAVILPFISWADSQQATFEKGNGYYAKGDYKAAVATYKQVIDGGYQSAALYYNMGNAAYRTDDIASALLYYEKAHKLAPGDEDINTNIRFVNLKTVDKIDESPEFFVTKWWRGFILSFSATGLGITSIIFILLSSGLLTLYFFAQSVVIKKASFYGAATALLLGILTIVIAASQADYFEGHQQAIIFSSFVNVKGGPGDKNNTLFVLHDGTKVNVLGINNGWVRIRIANGNEGWIRRSDAKNI